MPYDVPFHLSNLNRTPLAPKPALASLNELHSTAKSGGMGGGTPLLLSYFSVSGARLKPGGRLATQAHILLFMNIMGKISFIKNERIYEDEAVAKKSRQPANTFLFINKFLGALEREQEVFAVSRQFFEDFVIAFDSERKTVLFNLADFSYEEDSASDGEVQKSSLTLKVEEAVAMILKYAKKMSDAQSGQEVKECIITIPSHWNLHQRNALREATKIAGLNLLGLVHDNTAAALHFALDRLDENKTHTVLFYNLGAENLQTSIIQLQAVNYTKKKPVETVSVLADYGVAGLGGRSLDLIVAELLAEEFDRRPDRKGKPSIKLNRKVMMKLLQYGNRLKEQLSANKEIPVYIENLVDGKDFKGLLLRQSMEERAAAVF